MSGHAPELAEEDAEDHHGHDRLKDRPAGAKDRLLVADLDVPPDEEKEQLAEAPQFTDVEYLPTPVRLDNPAELTGRG